MADPVPTPAPQPSNGVKNGTPTQPANPPPDADAREAALKAREEALAKKEQAYRNELKKNAAEKTGLGAKLSEYEQLKKWKAEREQEDSLATLNPPAYAERRWGKDWWDTLMQAKTNGVPPANLIAQALADNDKKWETRLADLEGKITQREADAQRMGLEQARADVTAAATEFYEANAKEYPLLETYGEAAQIGQYLGALIEREFQRTGKLLSAKDAADKLEAAEYSRMEKAAGADKYKSKLRGEEKPATIQASSGSTSGAPGTQSGTIRRTLSNNLTASTPGRAPPRSDAERLERATQAFNAARAKNNPS